MDTKIGAVHIVHIVHIVHMANLCFDAIDTTTKANWQIFIDKGSMTFGSSLRSRIGA